jgi:hypothetical protein
MKVTLESTTKMVELVAEEGAPPIPARVWEGKTERGIPVVAFITRIAPDVEDPPAAVTEQFQAELTEQRAPQAAISRVIPLRLIL